MEVLNKTTPDRRPRSRSEAVLSDSIKLLWGSTIGGPLGEVFGFYLLRHGFRMVLFGPSILFGLLLGAIAGTVAMRCSKRVRAPLLVGLIIGGTCGIALAAIE